MSPQIATIIGLVIMFIVATAMPINMGAVAFALAFIIGGLWVDMGGKEVLAGFPGDLFLTLVGITYLFAIAQKNGTIDLLVHWAVKAVRGHIVAIPWVMFVITAVLTAFGALGPAAVAIIGPVALRFAKQYNINPLMMGLLVIHGAQAGGFSPISVYGSITNGVVQKAGLEVTEMAVFLTSLGWRRSASSLSVASPCCVVARSPQQERSAVRNWRWPVARRRHRASSRSKAMARWSRRAAAPCPTIRRHWMRSA